MKRRGFTLVELMITIAVLMLVTVFVAPMTGGWSASARRLTVQGSLIEAFGHARGAAIRNAAAESGNTPVATVCLNNSVLTVIKGSASGCGTTAAEKIWQSKVSSGVQITQNDSPYQCTCFDNKAQLTTATCTSCGTDFTFTIATGTANDEKETVVID